MATLEDLLAETGKFSRFQILILLLTLTPKILTGWSMLQMSFAAVVPDWWCVESDGRTDVANITKDNTTFQTCAPNETSHCVRVYSYAIRTIINEWDLVCENAWIKPAVTSIQMAGVLLGAMAGGQSADVIGRRYTLYLSLLVHGVANVVAAYSATWEMFAVMRFVLGFMIGSILVVSYTYPMEFIGIKERSVCSTIPNWPVGVSLFALAAWQLEDWSQLHLVCAALHVIFLVGFFFAPESVRWLAVQNRIDEAERVIYRMCSVNRTTRPLNCKEKLRAVAKEESRGRESRGKYTYVEIVRGWKMIKLTLMIDFVWCFMSVIYYGLYFGVDKLSGNLYLNIFLMTIIEIPGLLSVMYLTNKLGRRRCCAGLFFLGLLGAAGVVVTHYTVNVENKGTIINVFALIIKFGIGVGWATFQLLSSELYPTVIRNLGYGAANTAARVGGIISPFLFQASNNIGIPFIIIAILFAICATFSLLLNETNDTPLQDTLQVHVTEPADETRTEKQTPNETENAGKPGADVMEVTVESENETENALEKRETEMTDLSGKRKTESRKEGVEMRSSSVREGKWEEENNMAVTTGCSHLPEKSKDDNLTRTGNKDGFCFVNAEENIAKLLNNQENSNTRGLNTDENTINITHL